MKLIKRGLKNIIKDPSIFFNKKKQKIKLHFDMHHGYGILDRAIKYLDKKDRKDFQKFVSENYSFNVIKAFGISSLNDLNKINDYSNFIDSFLLDSGSTVGLPGGTGKTFNWIMKDWQQSCMPQDPAWKDIWNNNVRFAALTENLSSEFEHVTYYCDTVNKAENDIWLVYPWENVGTYDR